MAGKDSQMKKRHSAEQIVGKLRQADVALGKGLKVPEVCRQLGISEQTYYRWRQKYGGMAPGVARQLKGRTFTARDVMLTLQYLFAVRGAPEHVRSGKAGWNGAAKQAFPPGVRRVGRTCRWVLR